MIKLKKKQLYSKKKEEMNVHILKHKVTAAFSLCTLFADNLLSKLNSLID